MLTADVSLSSPAPPGRVDPYDLSSSPDLPSINEIFSSIPKKPPLPTGNRVSPIFDDACTTFTSGASLLREVPEIDIETEQITNSPPRKARVSKTKKKRTPTPEAVNVSVETPILIESSQEKPWQKFESKKSTPQSEQPPISKTRVAKQTTKGKQKGKTDMVSKHFPAREGIGKRADEKLDNGIAAQKLDDQIANDIHCSEPALRRRRDWTPPPPNDSILLESESDNRELHSSIDRGLRSKDVFNTLLDQYGCKHTTSSATRERLQQSGTLEKRKSLQLVSTGVEIGQHPREISPVKVVKTKTKKKTRTITELATAPYMPLMDPELDLAGPATKESLLSYFDEDGAVKALVDQQTLVMTQKKGKAKETKAPAKPKRKKKSGTMDNPILLSPNSALKQSSNQDFVFGTSSQLVRENSPTTLRDLQLAIRASNQVDSDPFADSDSQGLWHASARDTDGELMKIDDVELVRLPSLPQTQGRQQCSDEGFVDINDILKSDIDESIISPAQNSNVAISSAQPPQTNSETPTELTGETSNPRPDFELFNDSQLARQIASYGFKPVKKRQAMIALLGQCWLSKNPGVSIVHANSMSTSSSLSAPKRKQTTAAPQPGNPPKKRGRPRKNSVAEASTSKAAVPKETATKKPRKRRNKVTLKSIEIADSDLDESISSSSRESSLERDRIFSSPPAVDLSLSEEADLSLALSPTEQQADLFRHITKAVISAPRSQDPSNPSWHEKMLLYDPIILEDLAVWLNAGALSAAGYDGEVSPFDVKKWCESKSVICLWKQNSRGKERKRF
ncbi:hypothetical protein F4814DRAFT_78763 [Daldinia grandis]|nr:hypothetical protein F4814DRAFT_78763 [Daldinia grandis]